MDLYGDGDQFSRDERCDVGNRCELEATLADSIGRVLIGAPIEKRPVLFYMLVKTKAAEASAVRQGAIDECWFAACTAGLPTLIGTAAIQNWLVAAFGGGGM